MEAASIRNHKPVIEPEGTFSKKILNRLLIDLSYNSSRLEGNTYSLLDTEKLLIEGVGALEKLDEELNNLDEIAIAGLGVSKQELSAWKSRGVRPSKVDNTSGEAPAPAR